MMEWQPIETAPKDGTSVFLCKSADVNEVFEFFCQAAQWRGRSDAGAWVVDCDMIDDPLLHFEPTHWMPLPEPPEAE